MVVPKSHRSADLSGGPLPINPPEYQSISHYSTVTTLTLDGEEPTESEKATLRRISDKLPVSAWFVAVVELAERFSYYGLSGPFRKCTFQTTI